MKRCLLHIGAPKTGSTALQKFLADNRDALRRHGLEYPDASLRGYGHHDIAFVVGGGYPDWATPPASPRTLADLTRELAEKTAGSPSIVLSSEDFYLLPNPAGVAAMLGKAGFPAGSVTVVVYVRRQDEAHLSWYNQAVKAQGYSGTLAECVAETHALWDYAEQLERWAAVFGADRLDVRLYQPLDGPATDIRRDFLALAGIPADGFGFPDANDNSRINAEILEFQRLINRLPLTAQQKRGAHKELIELTAATAGAEVFADRPLMGSKERAAILKRYAASNRKVARRYFRRERLFDESMPKGLPARGARARLDNEKLVYIMGWLLARQHRT